MHIPLIALQISFTAISRILIVPGILSSHTPTEYRYATIRTLLPRIYIVMYLKIRTILPDIHVTIRTPNKWLIADHPDKKEKKKKKTNGHFFLKKKKILKRCQRKGVSISPRLSRQLFRESTPFLRHGVRLEGQ